MKKYIPITLSILFAPCIYPAASSADTSAENTAQEHGPLQQIKLPRNISLTANTVCRLLLKEVAAGNVAIIESYEALMEYLHNQGATIQLTAEHLDEIAKAFYLNYKDIDYVPAWLQAYFQGVSIRDLLDFDRIILSPIDPERPSEGLSLYLTNGQINDFDGLKQVPSAEQIELLIMDNKNKALHVPDDAFTKFENLTLLRFNNMGLTELPLKTLSCLKNLAYLTLDLNNILVIKHDTFASFANMRSLRTLDLFAGELTTIESGAFTHFNGLCDFVMYAPQLSKVEEGSFEGLTDLRSLWIIGSQLSDETKERIRAEMLTIAPNAQVKFAIV